MNLRVRDKEKRLDGSHVVAWTSVCYNYVRWEAIFLLVLGEQGLTEDIYQFFLFFVKFDIKIHFYGYRFGNSHIF